MNEILRKNNIHGKDSDGHKKNDQLFNMKKEEEEQ